MRKTLISPINYDDASSVKVLVCLGNFPSSSNEAVLHFVFEEASKISLRGIEVHVARSSCRGNITVDGLYVHDVDKKVSLQSALFSLRNIRSFTLSGFLHPLSTYYVSNFARHILKVAKQYNVDLIHAHFAFPEGFATMLACNVFKKPFVVTLHGYDIVVEKSIKYGVRLTKYGDEMVKRVLKNADKVLAASTYVYSLALKAGCPPEKLIYLPNGVDLIRFNPSIEGLNLRKRLNIASRPTVFTVRHHVPKNGIEYLIKAVPLVIREIPDAIFIIGGDGYLRRYHQALAEKLGVSRNIIFTGRIAQKELPLYYAACDLFVIPSVVEAFGLVALEAMACGKPVIGSNVGGIPDVIKDKENGFLVPPRDPKSLADKITLLLNDPKLAREMGLKGRKIAERNFDIEKRINRIIAIYQELLE